MPVYRYVVRFNTFDPRSAGLLEDAHLIGFSGLTRIECQELYFIEGQLSQEECKQLALKLFIDPITQSAVWDEMAGSSTIPQPEYLLLEVALHPGVTDPVAGQITRAAHELGFDGVYRAATGFRYLISGADDITVRDLAKRLLVNAVIQQWTVGEIYPTFPQESASSGTIEIFPMHDLSDEGLLALSKDRRAALDLSEMKVIRAYFRKDHRDPTDVELETIAQTWSEHCVHKTFKARINVSDRGVKSQINSLIKTYLRSATDEINSPWVLSAFVDNAGIIEFDDEYEVSFKVETHNHPSAIEPFGGANTGIGGVIRDVIGVSAKPIAATDILCFGPQNLDPSVLPAGVLHPRRIQSGVVAGVQDYGNKIGIPTVNGAILYDEGYTANPLVFCGCVGLAPKGKHVRRPGEGDRVIVLGGQTGRDGLRGATFSSMTMDAQTGEVSGSSVQIGDPITEKGLIDVIVRARDLGLYHAINDCGAGGLSSAVGEMASTCGAYVDLAEVRLKYPGLAPWEIWLSEAQERMVLAVASENIPALRELCETFDTEMTDIGDFSNSGKLIVRYGEQIVLNLTNEFLHQGIPQRQLSAVIADRLTTEGSTVSSQLPTTNLSDTLLKLLSHPNICSKASIIHLYDHEVQGGTVVKPLTGVLADGPSDACVLKPIGTKGMKGIVLSNGINPEYGKFDTYRMAWSVVDEAIRNAVAVGADPGRIAILDNFCWGDPLRPETLGTLVEAAKGCHDAAVHYGTPFISGKDSLNNEYYGTDGLRHAIPPTLLISALGLIDDVNMSITMDLKKAGNLLYLVGEFAPTFGGSHFNLVIGGQEVSENVPGPTRIAPKVYAALHKAICNDLVCSIHDLSEGGLAVAAAEMVIGGRLGLEVNLTAVDSIRMLFGETNGCLLVEVAPENALMFEKKIENLPVLRVATILEKQALVVCNNNQTLFSIPIGDLVKAWSSSR